MASTAERIARARALLLDAGIPPEDAALDAEVIARHLLGWDRARLLAQGREEAPVNFAVAFEALLARRAARVPVAQIVGHREFWNLEFEVTPDVLIPRPETELIVEEAQAFARDHACRNLVDVGTGSGCIAVSIARELPDTRVLATDSSAAALAVAARNAARHGVSARMEFQQTDVLDGVAGRFDLIVSNPPYIPDTDAPFLQPEVRDFEPRAALLGGQDGLEIIRRLMLQAASRLADNGRLIVEFGVGQEPALRILVREFEWDVVRVRQDLQGIPRTLVLTATRSPAL